MLYRLIRPLLFSLDPERAHGLAMAGARSLDSRPALARIVRRFVARPADRPVQLLGLSFPNRCGLAAGFDKNAEVPWAWWAFGFGFVEFGTVTPRGQPGHDKPRMFRRTKEQALINRMGFNNAGAEAVAGHLRKMIAGGRPPMPIGISVGKNKNTPLEHAVDDYADVARWLAPLADFVTVNVSSPNTASLRELQSPQALQQLILSVRRASSGKPVLVKFAPELEGDALRSALDACLDAGVAGVIATNTLSTANRSDLPQGGLSGRPLREISRDRVQWIRRWAGDQIAVIGCGGIGDAESARAMLDAGADLIQMYSALVYSGPFLPARLSRAIDK